MLMPSLFGENLLDDFFDMPMRSYRTQRENLMTTDIKEKDGNYEISMNLPGFKKEDIHAELKDGYLTISASTQRNNDEKDENGKYIRRERFSGNCSRSFYVGDQITEEDIKAKFENGTLTMIVPKKEAQPQVENKKYIAIEG